MSHPKIIFFSGAGISAPSGIKTFRDCDDGLWENFEIDKVCNENTWKDNFDEVHAFYNQRRKELATVQPNHAHEVISEMVEAYGGDRVYNLTQNVDDLFERAGCTPIHLHGYLDNMRCVACGRNWKMNYGSFDPENDRCECGSKKGVRPDVVFFYGDAPNYRYLDRALQYGKNPNTVIVVIGTTGSVVPIDYMIGHLPCRKILCNMESSSDIDDSNYDVVYYESVETAIDKIQMCVDDWFKVSLK